MKLTSKLSVLRYGFGDFKNSSQILVGRRLMIVGWNGEHSGVAWNQNLCRVPQTDFQPLVVATEAYSQRDQKHDAQ